MDAKTFLETLFGDAVSDSASIVIWEPGKKPSWNSDINSAVLNAQQRHEQADVYYSVVLQDPKIAKAEAAEIKALDAKAAGPEFTRGTARSSVGMPGLWIDIDIKNDHHSKVGLAQTLNQCVDGVMGLPMKPSIIVTTGGGIHAYWLFKEVWTLENNDERSRAQALVEGFQKWVSETCQFKVDATYDLARILRLPGSINHKYRRVVNASMPLNPAPRYNPSDFDDYSAKPKSITRVVVTTPLDIDLEAKVPEKIGVLLASDIQFAEVWHGRKKFPSPSERDMSIASRLVRYEGWTDQEICDALIANRRLLTGTIERKELRVEKLQYTIAKARKSYEEYLKAQEEDEIAKEMAADARRERLAEYQRLRALVPETPITVAAPAEEAVAGVQPAPAVPEVTPEAVAAEEVRAPLMVDLNAALGLDATKAIQRLIRYEGDEGSYILVMGGAQVKIGGIENLHNPDKFAMRLADGADRTPAIVTRQDWREQYLPILLGIVEHCRLGTGASLSATIEYIVARYIDQGINASTAGLLMDMPSWHDGEVWGTTEGLYRVAGTHARGSSALKSSRAIAEALARLGGHSAKIQIKNSAGKWTSRTAWRLTQDGQLVFVEGGDIAGRLVQPPKVVVPDFLPEGEGFGGV